MGAHALQATTIAEGAQKVISVKKRDSKKGAEFE